MRAPRMHRAALALAATAVLASGSGCGGDEPDRSPIPVGGIFTLEGPARDDSTLKGLRMALDRVNRGGGVEVGGVRRRLALVTLDDQAAPPSAVSAANELVNQRNVVALLGPVKSTLAIPVGAVAERGRVPMITSGSTNPATTRDRRFVFRTIVTDDFQGAVAASFARTAIGARRAALFYDASSPYSTGIAGSFRSGFERRRGSISATGTYTPDQRSRTRGLRRIARTPTDVLYLPNPASDAAAQGRAARRLGMEAILLGGDTWAEQDFLSSRPFRGSFHTAQWSPDLDDARSRRFVAAYRRRTGETPSQYAATAYDAVGLLARAITLAGRAEPEAIQQALAGITAYTGVSGALRYRGSGDPTTGAVVIRGTAGGSRLVAQLRPESIDTEPAPAPGPS